MPRKKRKASKPKPPPQQKSKVMVDSGTILMIDPGYLFSGQEWDEIAACAYPKKRPEVNRFKECLRKAFEKRGGAVGDFTIVNTGGDGDFPVQCKQDKVVVEPHVCYLEHSKQRR